MTHLLPPSNTLFVTPTSSPLAAFVSTGFEVEANARDGRLFLPDLLSSQSLSSLSVPVTMDETNPYTHCYLVHEKRKSTLE